MVAEDDLGKNTKSAIRRLLKELISSAVLLRDDNKQELGIALLLCDLLIGTYNSTCSIKAERTRYRQNDRVSSHSTPMVDVGALEVISKSLYDELLRGGLGV